jgi:hypothetical protein
MVLRYSTSAADQGHQQNSSATTRERDYTKLHQRSGEEATADPVIHLKSPAVSVA